VEDGGVGGEGFGASGGEFEFGDDGELDGRKAGFVVAGLVAEDERDFLGAERGVGSGGEVQANDESAFVHGELNGRELELAQEARRVRGGEDAEAGGQSGGDLDRDEVVLGGGVGVDVEARKNLADDGNFKRARARDRSQRDVGLWLNNGICAGERVRLSRDGGRQAEEDQQRNCEEELRAPLDHLKHSCKNQPQLRI